jgi:membrane protease YdiL (CAAX protease family)
LAFGFTWVLYLAGGQIEGPAAEVLRTASAFGPSLAALVLVLAARGRAGLWQWVRALCRWRLRWWWHVGTLAAPPAVLGVGVLVHRALGGQPGTSEHDPRMWWMIPVVFVIVLVVGGPLGEEFGWRGYALPRLQQVMGPVAASLLLGVLWGMWHLPRMVDPTSVQYLVPWWIFLGQVVVMSVFYTWLLNRTASVVPALTLHASFNTSVGLLPVLPDATGSVLPALVSLGIATVGAAALILRTRGRLGT